VRSSRSIFLAPLLFALPPIPAAVSDSFAELSVIDGRRIDGALGFPLFADLYLGLDFPNQRLLLGRKWPASAPAIRATRLNS
jgi:hypothetical protein